ncbi:hypothetical protein [Formosa algae]|uniref:hypothetical protein n=1 Tax=Formosa algae TaxID=225843 RepID=UPI000CCEA137|nr:hypothetical protein [Formosa algae]PNW27032.1 hypothetical protein BKP44_14635 [Formosa algae]
MTTKLFRFPIFICGLILSVASCNSDDDLTNYEVCTYEIVNSPADDTVTAEEEVLAESLFAANNIASGALQITAISTDLYLNDHVYCNQFLNGLQILNHDLIYHFDAEGSFYQLSGYRITETELDTEKRLTENYVTNVFLNEVAEDGASSSELDDIIAGCVDIQFGYFEQFGGGIDYEFIALVKAWKVTPHDADYPVLYLNDSNSELIYYGNGIQTN